MGLSWNLNSHLGLVATILASVGLDKQLIFAACGLPLPIAHYVWHKVNVYKCRVDVVCQRYMRNSKTDQNGHP